MQRIPFAFLPIRFPSNIWNRSALHHDCSIATLPFRICSSRNTSFCRFIQTSSSDTRPRNTSLPIFVQSQHFPSNIRPITTLPFRIFSSNCNFLRNTAQSQRISLRISCSIAHFPSDISVYLISLPNIRPIATLPSHCSSYTSLHIF